MEKKKKKKNTYPRIGRRSVPHKPISKRLVRKKKKTVITTGNAGTCLANELPGDAVRLDLDFPNMYHQPKPQAPSPSTNGQMAKFGWGKSIRTMTKDLSVTVPFSPAIVLGPSSNTGDLAAVSHPYSFQPFSLFTIFQRDKGQDVLS